MNNVSELKRVLEGGLGKPMFCGGSRVIVSLIALLGGASACGHYGVDLDGVVDASIDASGESDTTTKPSKPKPSETAVSDSSAPNSSDGKTHDGSSSEIDISNGDASVTGGETKEPAETEPTRDVTSGDAAPPTDASVDGSIVEDAGADADASWDVESSEEPDSETTRGNSDAGPPICEPTCSCAEGVDCDLLCLGQECLATCEANALCDVVVGAAPTVKVDCARGALCSALEMTAESVNVTCSGEGDCHAECDGEQDCAVDCKGPGRCVTKCHGEAQCDVTCKEGAECFVVYDNVENVTLTCDVGSVNHCDGLVTCDAACP